MKEIESNKEAWSKISKDHYETFKKLFNEGEYILNPYIRKELGDIKGKKLIHLQCNTGVDLVPDNIFYAKNLLPN